jgi:predicted small integral membrane protein
VSKVSSKSSLSSSSWSWSRLTILSFVEGAYSLITVTVSLWNIQLILSCSISAAIIISSLGYSISFLGDNDERCITELLNGWAGQWEREEPRLPVTIFLLTLWFFSCCAPKGRGGYHQATGARRGVSFKPSAHIHLAYLSLVCNERTWPPSQHGSGW